MSAVATKPKSGPPGPLIPQSQVQDVDNLDLIVKQSNAALIEASQSGNELRKAIIMSKAIPAIKSALMPLMDDIMELMDTPLGFRTDRPPGTVNKDGKPVAPYTKNQVADVLTIGLLRGFRITLNEINIIAAQFYGTKEGYERLLKDLPGLTDLRIDIGVPKMMGDKGSVIDCKASWRYRGVEGSLICEGGYAIPVRMNAGMGTDAAQGKATSKMLRRIYKIITNIDPGEGEDSLDDRNTVDGHIVDQSNTKQAPGS